MWTRLAKEKDNNNNDKVSKDGKLDKYERITTTTTRWARMASWTSTTRWCQICWCWAIGNKLVLSTTGSENRASLSQLRLRTINVEAPEVGAHHLRHYFLCVSINHILIHSGVQCSHENLDIICENNYNGTLHKKKPALALKLLLQTRKSILINLYTFMEIFYPQNFYSTGRPRKCADCGTERWGCENDDTMTGQLKSAIKLIYAPGGWRDLDNLGTTKVCLALHQEMELLGCYINFIKNQIFG